MKVQAGTKVTTEMANGIAFPGVALGEATSEEIEVVSRQTGEKVTIKVTRFDVISLRTTNPANGPVTSYLVRHSEVENYGFRPIASPRFNTIPGLDADPETGEKYTLQMLSDLVSAARATFLAQQYEARHAVTAAEDL
jgi:hypothetical protein